jgi:phosphate transport system substrate-binding protein
MGENDNLIISKLTNEPTTLGVFGFSFLDQNSDKVKGSNIDGNPITFENIATGAYPVSRPLYFYVKNDHRDSIKGLNQFINEFVSDDAMGEEGYLLDKGLIPALEEEHAKTVNNARNAVPLQL